MLQQAVYELTTVDPHVPDDARLAGDDYARYREGYTMALMMALRVIELAERRYQLYVNTRRLEAKRRREQEKASAAE